MIGSETECYGYALWMYPSKDDQHCNGANTLEDRVPDVPAPRKREIGNLPLLLRK